MGLRDPYNTAARCKVGCRCPKNITCEAEYQKYYSLTLCPPRTKWSFFEVSKIRCLPIECPAGYEIGADNRTCAPCKIGYYKAQGGPSECTACPINTYGISAGAAALNAGCNKCPLNSDTEAKSSVGPRKCAMP